MCGDFILQWVNTQTISMILHNILSHCCYSDQLKEPTASNWKASWLKLDGVTNEMKWNETKWNRIEFQSSVHVFPSMYLNTLLFWICPLPICPYECTKLLMSWHWHAYITGAKRFNTDDSILERPTFCSDPIRSRWNFIKLSEDFHIFR